MPIANDAAALVFLSCLVLILMHRRHGRFVWISELAEGSPAFGVMLFVTSALVGTASFGLEPFVARMSALCAALGMVGVAVWPMSRHPRSHVVAAQVTGASVAGVFATTPWSSYSVTGLVALVVMSVVGTSHNLGGQPFFEVWTSRRPGASQDALRAAETLLFVSAILHLTVL